MPIRSHTVLYEAYSGRDITCHPEAIFHHLRRNPDFAHLKHVWVLSDEDRIEAARRQLAHVANLEFVVYGSPAYQRTLATAKYLVNNVTFPLYFVKRPGQVYVNTWHGTPLKAMGLDIHDRRYDARNILRNFLAIDYFIAENDYSAERMFLDAFKMRNIYNGRIVVEGSARTDRQLLDDTERDAVLEQLAASGVHVGGRRIVLYAPTWRGANYFAPNDDPARLAEAIRHLSDALDPERFIVLLKPHQVVSDALASSGLLPGQLVPNSIPTNPLLGLTDLLISDYSSIFVDFLATGRPLVFHVPDLDDYRRYRGLYRPVEEFPGPKTKTLDELADAVRAGLAADWHPGSDYVAQREELASKDDGSVCERIVDIVWRGREAGYDVRDDFADGRRRVLIYLGAMLQNGITTAALNLISSLDHARYDVTVMYPWSTNATKFDNAQQISQQARPMPWQGPMNATRFEHSLRKWENQRGKSVLHAAAQEAMWSREWRRLFGDATFDIAIDFSGYAPFWANILARSGAPLKAVWMHNDLLADANRTVSGRQPLKTLLESLFSYYDRFDLLVSVSDALAEVNRVKLSRYAPPEKFVSVRNTLDVERIIRLAFGDPMASVPRTDVAELASQCSLRDAVDWLLDTASHELVLEEVEREALVRQNTPRAPGTTTFITVGRLSPEKNHERLLKAFAAVHRDYPGARLVIVGGGPLQRAVKAMITDLHLDRAVKMTGQVPNPYAMMHNSQCLVVSSDYEGQPMVILEALVIGLPVVTTNFNSVWGALSHGQGLVVDSTVAGLADGLRAFLEGEVSAGRFDSAAYNASALKEFYELCEGKPR
jgi:CDP-glycerol glycerophosphotransferase (TagB/SpsB family)